MDCNKIGKLIFKLRKEQGMTQKQVADAMNISDKTISKWERGMGCPDVTLLKDLSKILGVNIDTILSGNIETNETNGGNMKKIKFYVCPNCNAILNSTGNSEVSCCGRVLEPLKAKKADANHEVTIEAVENDYYVTFKHPMTKSHYISFFASVVNDRMLLIKLYPEQNPEIRFPKMKGEALYYYCNKHGLWRHNK